jgi:hypothetical protein
VSRGINPDPDSPVAAGGIEGVLDDRGHYIRAASGREELYLHPTDPHELDDVARNPGAQALVREYRRRLDDVLRRPPSAKEPE